MIEKENHYRQLFAENPNASEIQDPHLMLENVFEHANEFVYQDESADEVRRALARSLCLHFFRSFGVGPRHALISRPTLRISLLRDGELIC